MNNHIWITALVILLNFAQINCQTCEGLKDGYYADISQCDRYYLCRNQTIFSENLCNDGLVFNEYGNLNSVRCELPMHVDCSNRPELQPAQPTKNCPRKYGMFADEKDCAKFIHCADGFAFPTVCAPGLVFNPANGICDWPESVPDSSCSTEQIVGFKCPSVEELLIGTNQVDLNYAKHMKEFNLHIQSRHPHPSDCARFYVCLYNGFSKRVPRELSCEFGLVYNADSGECDDPKNVATCENYYAEKNEDGTNGGAEDTNELK